MTDSPSEPAQEAAGEMAEGGSTDVHAEFAERVAGIVGSDSYSVDHGTAQVRVDRTDWVEAVRKARDEADLPFFSWLSGIDWSKEVAVGEPVEDVDTLDERYEVLVRLSSVKDATGVMLVATVPKDDAWIDSLVPLFAGAAWHERETAEMFGIDFRGHPGLTKLYLPDSFEGHPLRKSYPLLSREVKPWPGMVDVEDMPSTENVEAAAQEATQESDA